MKKKNPNKSVLIQYVQGSSDGLIKVDHSPLTNINQICCPSPQNLVVLISGGASRLGQATANRLANKGAQIVLTDLPQTNGAAIAKEIGENVHFIPADATSEESVVKVVNDISKQYGKLNVLVNCLGYENVQKDNKTDDFDHFSDRLQVFFVCFVLLFFWCMGSSLMGNYISGFEFCRQIYMEHSI